MTNLTLNNQQKSKNWSLITLLQRFLSSCHLVILSAVIAVLLLAFGNARAWPLRVDIGGSDARFIDRVRDDDPTHGFHAVEDFAGRAARWSSGDAQISLPRPPADAAAILSVELHNSRPQGFPDPQVTLSTTTQAIGPFSVPRTEGGVRTYRVLLRGGTQLDWATRIQLQSDTITLPNDPRPLGVVVDRVWLAPMREIVLLPSLWLALCGVALGALGYALPRMLGAKPLAALLVSAGIAALVGGGLAARATDVLPFVQRIPMLLALGCGGLLVTRWLSATTDHRPPTTNNSVTHSVSQQVSVGGAQLPLYLAVAWWLGPAFELMMTADGARSVTPAPATTWIGGALLVALLGIGAWSPLKTKNKRTKNQEPRTEKQRYEQLRQLVSLSACQLILIVFAIASVAHLVSMIWFAYTRNGPDFWILFKGARDWARGGSLYDLQAVIENHFGHVFKVPPFYGMLFVPFVFQDGFRILLFHRIINTVLLSATALVWFRMWNIRLLSAIGAGILILLNFRPFADTMAFGQIDLALLLILTLALWALQRDQSVLAGALVALGTLFKVYPVILLAFFVVKRDWRAIAGFVVGMIVYNGISIAVMGWEMHRVYLFEVLPRIGGTTAWVENQTISGFIARFFSSPADGTIFANRAVTMLATAISALVSALGCLLMFRPAERHSTLFAMQYSLFPLLMVLVVPAAWMHYETLLFIPFGVLLLHWRDRDVSIARAASFAASFALVAYGNQWSFYDGTVMGVLTVLGVSYKFYGMLLLGGLLSSALLEEWAIIRRPLAMTRRISSVSVPAD